MKKILSFDIGGTDVKYGLITANGTLLEKGIFPSNNGNGLHILMEIDKLLKTKYLFQINGIAVSTPGFINPYNGVVHRGGAIQEFNNINLKEKLEKTYGLPVSVENDANCAAHAEKWLGFAKDLNSFICITVGTGIGGAIYIENKILRGKNYRAGEFGSMFLGEQRNWNSFSSLKSLRQIYAQHNSMDNINFSTAEIFNKRDQGDSFSTLIISDFYKYLAQGIYNIFTIFDPEIILIGGGVSQREDMLQEIMQHISVFNRYNEEIIIKPCKFKNDAGILGAAYFHLNTIS